LQPAEWACFLRTDDLTVSVRAMLRETHYVVGIREEGRWTRVLWADPRVRLRCCARDGWFAKHGIATFEADVDPVRRWLTDHDHGIARPRRVFLDLEADSRIAVKAKEQARMLAWSIYDPAAPEGSRSRHEVLAEDSDVAEKNLITSLWQALDPYDQVCAWAGDWFDFPYLDARTARRGLRPERRLWLWLDHLTLYRRLNAHAAESGDEKQSLSLDAVARSLGLGGKLEGVDRAQSWDEWLRDPERLGRYCARDSELTSLIEDQTGYIELQQTLAESTFVFADSAGIGPKQQVESFMLRLGRERGTRFPTHHYRDEEEAEEEERFRGAYVMEPARGILRDVHVCDFARLYPSIILTWNMSPETWRPELSPPAPEKRPSYLAHLPPAESPRPEGVCEAPLTRRFFANEPAGLLPIAIAEMLRLRKAWDDRKKSAAPGTPEWVDADRRSSAYKIAGNSFYGVVGSQFSRFFVREVAEAVAQAGVWLLRETMAAVERWGENQGRKIAVAYADTDSAFVTGCSQQEFDEFVTWCNRELYPQLLRQQGCTRNHVNLAYEKAFRKIVFVGKKRYAGSFLHYKGKSATEDSKPEIKGLEYKRGDTLRLARELQRDVIYRLLGYRIPESERPEDFEAMVELAKRHVLGGSLPLHDVVFAKKLAKAVSQYARKRKADGEFAAQPAHVEVARILAERGEDVGKGRRIEYVVVDGEANPIKVVPASDFDGTYDAHYLWESAVWPPTQRVLEAAFPAQDWSRHDRVRPPRERPMTARQQAAAAQRKLFG